MTERNKLTDEVVQLAARGRMHHSYVDLDLTELLNSRNLIRDLGREVIKLRGTHGEGLEKSK